MSNKITELLAESRRIEEAATPGPWGTTVRSGYNNFEVQVWSVPVAATEEFAPEIAEVLEGPDAEFIAYARTSEPRMRRALEAVMALTPHRYPDADDPERNLGDPVLWQAEVFRAIESALTEEEEGE